MLKIRRPLGRLIFNMGIAIPGKTVFLIETAPWFPVSQCSVINWWYLLSKVHILLFNCNHVIRRHPCVYAIATTMHSLVLEPWLDLDNSMLSFLKQCWNIVNWTTGHGLQRNDNQIYTFSFKKMPLKISSGKWRPFCLGLNVLRTNCFIRWMPIWNRGLRISGAFFHIHLHSMYVKVSRYYKYTILGDITNIQNTVCQGYNLLSTIFLQNFITNSNRVYKCHSLKPGKWELPSDANFTYSWHHKLA